MKMTGCWKENHGEDIGYKDIMHISLHPDSLFIRHFYIQMHLHTYFAFKPFCTKTTQTLLPTNPFYIHRRLCTQTHLQYTEICFSTHTAFTYRCFYTQSLLHTETFIHKSNTRTVIHRRLYTQTLLRTDVFSNRGSCIQKLLPTKAIKHRS